LKGSEADVRRFKDALTGAILRTISIVRILPLHGIAHELETVEKAIDYLNHYDEKPAPDLAIAKYEVQIRYNNGDRIDAFFERKADAISHLSRYLPEARPATS
jgi:hypothetical protein